MRLLVVLTVVACSLIGYCFGAIRGFQAYQRAEESRPDICIVQREWTAEVDGHAAEELQLACQRYGSLWLVADRGE